MNSIISYSGPEMQRVQRCRVQTDGGCRNAGTRHSGCRQADVTSHAGILTQAPGSADSIMEFIVDFYCWFWLSTFITEFIIDCYCWFLLTDFVIEIYYLFLLLMFLVDVYYWCLLLIFILGRYTSFLFLGAFGRILRDLRVLLGSSWGALVALLGRSWGGSLAPWLPGGQAPGSSETLPREDPEHPGRGS